MTGSLGLLSLDGHTPWGYIIFLNNGRTYALP